MGWAGGSQMLYDILSVVYKHLPKEKRATVCTQLINIFTGEDCDTIEEAFDKKWPELKAAYYKIYPEYLEEDDE